MRSIPLFPVAQNHEPVYNFISEDQVGHKLWVVDDDKILDSLASAFEKLDKIYIADGHHRTASAAAVGKLRRAISRSGRDAPYNYFMAAIFPDSDLSIMAHNRVVHKPAEKSYETILAEIEKNFAVERQRGYSILSEA